MGTVATEDGFQLVIFTHDHAPAHVHIRKNGRTAARIKLEPVEVMDSYLTQKELRKAIELVEKYRELALEKWDAIHPRR